MPLKIVLQSKQPKIMSFQLPMVLYILYFPPTLREKVISHYIIGFWA